MVDVGDKPITARTAVAEGAIRMSADAFRLVAEEAVAKGDVLAVSEVAGTLAAKRTAELIPLCHPVGLDHVEVEASLDEPNRFDLAIMPNSAVTVVMVIINRSRYEWLR